MSEDIGDRSSLQSSDVLRANSTDSDLSFITACSSIEEQGASENSEPEAALQGCLEKRSTIFYDICRCGVNIAKVKLWKGSKGYGPIRFD
jgi:hypothetical protein